MVSAGGLVYIPHHTLSHHHPDNLNVIAHVGYSGDASNVNTAASAALPPQQQQERQQHEEIDCTPHATVGDVETLPPPAPVTTTTTTAVDAGSNGDNGGGGGGGGGSCNGAKSE